MSPEPSATAQATYAALNARDLGAFLDEMAEDVEFTSLVAEVEGTTYRGHAGVREWWRDVLEGFGEMSWEILDFDQRGDDAVLRFHVTGTLGEVPVELKAWQAVRIRDDKVVWWGSFRTEAEARAAVGLPA